MDPDTFTVTPKEEPPSVRIGTGMHPHPCLRRWDHPSEDSHGIPVTESAEHNAEWIDLEGGAQIQFLPAHG